MNLFLKCSIASNKTPTGNLEVQPGFQLCDSKMEPKVIKSL